MKIEKRIHKGWEEWDKITKEQKWKSIFGLEGWVGKHQYIYSSKKGEISLVNLKAGMITNEDHWVWEIYEFSKNNLFEDVERFETKDLAEARIKELLE